MNDLEIIAQIDYHYWMLGCIARIYTAPKDQLSNMIDDATGYTKDIAKQSQDILTEIVRLKKLGGYDYSHDEDSLSRLNKLTTPE